MADKNEKWKYVGVTVVIMALVACYYGQPMQFMENQLGMECTNCAASNVPADVTWNGLCTDAIEDACCVEVPCPTCELVGGITSAPTCEGTCPVPESWAGWTGECELYYPVYGYGCKCVYYPPV